MDEFTQSTLKDIRDVIASKPNISYLCDTVVMGSIYTGKGFIASEGGIDNVINSSWIRLVRLNKVFLKKYIEWKYGGDDGYRNDERLYMNVFNDKYQSYTSFGHERTNYTYLGSNVDRNINLVGYHYNACDIYNSYIIENNIKGYQKSMNTNTYSSFIYKYLFIGQKNFLIGFIDRTGILYLDYIILNKIKKTDNEKFTEVVTNILSIYANINSIFFELNINGISGEIGERVKRTLLTKVNDMSKECTIIQPDHIDLFSDSCQVDNLVSKMKDLIHKEVDKYLADTKWGINNQYSFKNILDNIISKKFESSKYDIEKAFANGLLYGNKFELSGWIVSDKQFDNCVTWEKEVNIIPSRVNYKGQLYNINNNDPQWKNPFHIDKLYVTAAGKMYCDGVHPNVSSQSVCMGDISGKIVLSDVKKLGENLNRCEALLTLINYDSAYRTDKLDEIISHSIIDSVSQFKIDNEYVGDNETLTDVSFEDEEDDPINNDDQTNIEIVSEE